jgi:hypothetical protein
VVSGNRAGPGLSKLDFFNSPTWRVHEVSGKRLSNEGHGDGTFCTNCYLGATTKKLDEKASLYEGHGFSRAVNSLPLDGFSR